MFYLNYFLLKVYREIMGLIEMKKFDKTEHNSVFTTRIIIPDAWKQQWSTSPLTLNNLTKQENLPFLFVHVLDQCKWWATESAWCYRIRALESGQAYCH